MDAAEGVDEVEMPDAVVASDTCEAAAAGAGAAARWGKTTDTGDGATDP